MFLRWSIVQVGVNGPLDGGRTLRGPNSNASLANVSIFSVLWHHSAPHLASTARLCSAHFAVRLARPGGPNIRWQEIATSQRCYWEVFDCIIRADPADAYPDFETILHKGVATLDCRLPAA